MVKKVYLTKGEEVCGTDRLFVCGVLKLVTATEI